MSTALARAVVDALLDAGLRHAVLAPGSRNAPLAFALLDADRAGALTLHTRVDERTAGFLGLGMARAGRAPVAVVTTSGTAAAELHPALLEAAHTGVRLVAVTADRPARLRGTIANQTTDQVGLYGAAVPSYDVSVPDDLPAFDAHGPVHLNVQLDEPLVPEDSWSPAPREALARRGPQMWRDPSPLPSGPRTVVVAGDDAGPAARVLAENARWPLLAEPSSGSRNGTNPIRTYRLLLGTELADRIERVVVVGTPSLSRPVQQLLAREDVEVVSVRPRGWWAGRPHPVAAEYDGVTAEPDDPGWLEEWLAADADVAARLDALVTGGPELTPYDVAAVVNAAVPADGLLVVGASNPIRDLDLMARPYGVGERRMVLANRGLAGIDGTLSTAIGAAIARPHSARTIAYVGDVTFLHDANALLLGPDERRPDVTIVVANDDGGSIFATLEQGAERYAPAYERLFGTPHGVDLAALCAATRTPHWRVTGRGELEHALASPNGGIEVVEAVVRRDNRRATDQAIRALVRA